MKEEILQEAEIHQVMSHMPVTVLKPLTATNAEEHVPTVQERVVDLFKGGGGVLAFRRDLAPDRVGEAVQLATKIGDGAAFRVIARKADTFEI